MKGTLLIHISYLEEEHNSVCTKLMVMEQLRELRGSQ